MLTDSEVDRRFATLVADLNSVVQTVDWRGVNEPVDRAPENDLDAGEHHEAGLVAVRLLAIVVALVMVGAGIGIASSLGFNTVVLVLWFALVVPAVTLGALVLFDQIRGRRGE